MSMVRLFLLIVICIFLNSLGLRGNDSLWTLERCILYAKENNLTIQQSLLDQRVAKLNLDQSRLSQLPNTSFSTSLGRNYGRSINPTTNVFENRTFDFMGVIGNGNVLLFGWFEKKNTIERNQLAHIESLAHLDQLKDDLALNIATAYLRILLAQSEISINKRQLEVRQNQLDRTQRMLDAGKSNGLEITQVKTQLSIDSVELIKSLLAYEQAIIDLKAILNLEFENDLSIVAIDTTQMDFNRILDINPEEIYYASIEKMGNPKALILKEKIARKSIDILKSSLYPHLSLNASLGTNYSSTFYQVSPNGEVNTMPWNRQLQNNFTQSISLGISLLLFNGLASRYAIKNAKIELQRAELKTKEENLKLKQDIYKACNDAKVALQTYYATKSTIDNAYMAYEFASKRYEAGLINAFELLSAQTQLFKSDIENTSAKYDLIFKMFVLDYFNQSNLFSGG